MLSKEKIDKANQYSIDIHSNLMSETNDEHKIVAQNEISHRKRLNKIIELGNFNGKSILDIGCGLGALYSLLKEKNIDVEYYGIDINTKLIERAKEKYPEIADNFWICDIIENDLGRKFDYVVAVGILNLDFGENINLELKERFINQIHKHSIIGYALNMTSSLTRKPSPESFYYKPSDLVTMVSKICNNFKLDHTYMPHDFAIFCYIDDFYSNYNNK